MIPTPYPFARLEKKVAELALHGNQLCAQAASETRTFRKEDLEREDRLLGRVWDAISARIPDERVWSEFDTVDIFAQHMDSTYVRTFQASLLAACDGLSSAAGQSLAVPRLSNRLVRTVARLRNIHVLGFDTRAATGPRS